MENTPKVLIVDDEQDYRVLLKDVFCQHGYEVQIAANAREASMHAEQARPDLLIIDWLLKDAVDGLTVANSLHQANKELKTILITGFPETAGVEEREWLRIIRKPFREADILDAASDLLS